MITEQTDYRVDAGTPDILFCVKNSGATDYKGEFDKKATVHVGALIDIKFRGINIPDKSRLVYELGTKDTAAITAADIGKIHFESSALSRVSGKPAELEIKNSGNKKEIEFEITNFKVVDNEGESAIKLSKASGAMLSDSLLLVKEKEKKPEITFFKADKYFVINGENVTLTWDAKNADSFIIKYDKSQTLAGTERMIVIPAVHDKHEFRLVAKNEAGEGTIDPVNIKAFGQSTITVESGLFPENARVLNIFRHEETGGVKKMYAFVQLNTTHKTARFFAAQPNPEAPWERLTKEGRDIELDIELASRPCAVLGDKLILTGGSAYHPDVTGNTYCVFDIAKGKLIENDTVIRDAGKNIQLAPRMGHTCLLHNGSIWIIGGYDPDHEKAFSDIWRYNGSAWEKLAATLPFGGRCMMAACSWKERDGIAVQELWMYGGYPQSPCGDIAHQLCYMDAGNNFHDVPCSIEDGSVDIRAFRYNGVGLQVYRDRLYLFADKAYKIYKENDRWVCKTIGTNETERLYISNDWVYPSCGHKLQLVEHASVIWLNALDDYNNEKKLGRLRMMFYACFVN